MRCHLRLPAVTAALLLSVTLTACSSSTPDSAGGGGRPPADATATATATATDETDAAVQVGPLEDYLGVGVTTGSGSDESSLREFEETIARCMASQGFEYVPFVEDVDATFLPDGTVTLDFEAARFPDLPPAQFAARFGYGFSTRSLAGQQDEREQDPNEAIVARMSVAERVAYHQALYGKGNALDSEGYLAGAGISSSAGSCQGRAAAQEPTTDELATAERRVERVRESFASLLQRVRDLRDDEMKDPRVLAATSTWSACLAAAGQPGFTDLDQPRARAREDAVKLLGRDLSGSATADPARLEALRSAEVDLAVADEQCLGAWRSTFKVVKQDLEEQFVHDNVAELEEFRSAMSAAVADQR